MDIYTININRGFELCAARRRPPASIAIPVCQAGCTIASDTIVDRAARYYKEERDIYPSPFFPGSLCSKTAFPMFCLARREARSSFQSGPNIGRPRQMAGPDRGGRSDRLRFQGWPRQNGLSYALPLIPRTPSSICGELYLYSCALTVPVSFHATFAFATFAWCYIVIEGENDRNFFLFFSINSPNCRYKNKM